MTDRDKRVEELDSLVRSLRENAKRADSIFTNWCLGYPAAGRALDAELRVLESRAVEARSLLHALGA